MTAEIISVGTELLLGSTTDTNAVRLSQVLANHGVGLKNRQTVGDHRGRLVEALRLALSRSDLVFTIGGLGPTQDDLTREGVEEALGVEFRSDPALEAQLRELFLTMKRGWVESQIRQTMRPESSTVLENPHGTAPGLHCWNASGKHVILLPGPPNEFNPMVETYLPPILVKLGGGRVIHSRTVRVAGLGEAAAEERLLDLLESTNPTVAPYAKSAEVHFRVTAEAESVESAEAKIAPMVAILEERLAPYVYGFDEETLEMSIVRDLKKRGQTLSVAESCTGGGLGARIASVPGASGVFPGGVISYSNEVKTHELGVESKILEEHGAVSEECARAMAEGCRDKFQATYALSVTGIAGPDGGTAEKPVGTVFVACAGPGGTVVRPMKLRGSRSIIQTRSTQAALILLREILATGIKTKG